MKIPRVLLKEWFERRLDGLPLESHALNVHHRANPKNSRQSSQFRVRIAWNFGGHMVVHFGGVGFHGQAIEPSLRPLFGKDVRSLHDSLCRRGHGILENTLALLLMSKFAKTWQWVRRIRTKMP